MWSKSAEIVIIIGENGTFVFSAHQGYKEREVVVFPESTEKMKFTKKREHQKVQSCSSKK